VVGCHWRNLRSRNSLPVRAVLRQCALPEKTLTGRIRFCCMPFSRGTALQHGGLAGKPARTFPNYGELSAGGAFRSSACCWGPPARITCPDRAGPNLSESELWKPHGPQLLARATWLVLRWGMACIYSSPIYSAFRRTMPAHPGAGRGQPMHQVRDGARSSTTASRSLVSGTAPASPFPERPQRFLPQILVRHPRLNHQPANFDPKPAAPPPDPVPCLQSQA